MSGAFIMTYTSQASHLDLWATNPKLITSKIKQRVDGFPQVTDGVNLGTTPIGSELNSDRIKDLHSNRVKGPP
eukprot:14353550-Ditylum_brightwellii.AAC.1